MLNAFMNKVDKLVGRNNYYLLHLTKGKLLHNAKSAIMPLEAEILIVDVDVAFDSNMDVKKLAPLLPKAIWAKSSLHTITI